MFNGKTAVQWQFVIEFRTCVNFVRQKQYLDAAKFVTAHGLNSPTCARVFE
jgi:hypothetical protein